MQKAKTSQQATAKYYSRLGSRLGYLLVMRRSQHFGYYDQNHQNEDAAQAQYHKKFSELLKLKPGMKLLDAGCGQGVVACYLAKHFKVNVTGITIAKHEVKTAAKRAKKSGVSDSTEFLLADYSNPPFKAEAFDLIYTTETLSHSPNVQKTLEALSKVLKPGGKMVFAEYMMDHKNFDKKDCETAEFVKKYGAIHGIYQFGEGEFASAIKKAGLVLEKEYDWTSTLKPSFDRLRQLAGPVAKVVKTTRLNKHFINTLAAAVYSEWVEKGVFAYRVYIVTKPGPKNS